MTKLKSALEKIINSKKSLSVSKNIGRVISISDGVVRAEGLFEVQVGEMVIFESGLRGKALLFDFDMEWTIEKKTYDCFVILLSVLLLNAFVTQLDRVSDFGSESYGFNSYQTYVYGFYGGIGRHGRLKIFCFFTCWFKSG